VIDLKRVPVLYLDLDGTVRHHKDDPDRFVNQPDDVMVYPEAVTVMKRWKDHGGRIIGVSNQGGIALGYITQEQCAATMRRTNELTGGLFDHIAWCRHYPSVKNPEMARCWCRKPAPGLIIEAAQAVRGQHPDEMYPPHMALMVGDRPEDRGAAAAANIDFMDAAEWRAHA
jgi:D-glycero-D-manno-heptose 1,7-bisphosphate phosphatase